MKTLKHIILFTFCSTMLFAQDKVQDKTWSKLAQRNDLAWFATDSAKAIAETVLLYQRDIGGWPKNMREERELTPAEKAELVELKSDAHGCTTDNGATFLEMTYLSKMYSQVKDERYKVAFLKGLDYLLVSQYDNGGWPQFYPLKKGYATHITYNDDSMYHIMEILNSLIKNDGRFSIHPDEATIARCKTAFDRGIDVILKTQYKQNGVLTAWCAQHDEVTLAPAPARAFELESLSGQESVGLVLILMSVDNPSQEIKDAVNAAVVWFEKTKIEGYERVGFRDENGNKDSKIVANPDAKPMWGRFMNLEDNRPFFCGRDGVKKYDLQEIEQERRGGYGWYTIAPNKVLRKYPKWKKKWDS